MMLPTRWNKLRSLASHIRDLRSWLPSVFTPEYEDEQDELDYQLRRYRNLAHDMRQDIRLEIAINRRGL